MLREYEPERRRLRDDAELDHARWERYRDEKRQLEDLGLTPHDYDARIKKLARELEYDY